MKRSKFNLSHEHSTTIEMGKLIPMVMIDCLPGDIHRLSCQTIFRAQPMIAPLAHLIHYDMQYYFVPYRLIWEDFPEFITGGISGSSAFEFPVLRAPEKDGWSVNSLADYMGFPINEPEIEVSALPMRAVCKIWNDHYKVEDIESDIEYSLSSGLDTTTPQELLPVHWKRDRFTRAKPFTQRGPQVNVPIYPVGDENVAQFAYYNPTITPMSATTVKPPSTRLFVVDYIVEGQTNVIFNSINVNPQFSPKNNNGYIEVTILGRIPYSSSGSCNTSVMNNVTFEGNFLNCRYHFYIPVTIDWGEVKGYSDSFSEPFNRDIMISGSIFNECTPANGNLSVVYPAVVGDIKISMPTAINFYVNNVTSASGSLNIRDLRTASALQRYQEKSLKYGSEYEDYCRMEFGVRPRDSRLQKSEYIGGGRSVLQISEIFQTTPTDGSPLGSMAGSGIGSYRQRRIKYHCPEHGIIIGFASIRPTTLYTQGIERAWLKRSRFEFFTREFQAIGAQEILEQELYATKDNAQKIFGYDLNGNYQEYRSMQNRVSGNFRTDLSFWNLSRIFDKAPILNPGFLIMNPRKDIFAIQDGTLPPFLVMQRNLIVSYRPIPKKVKARLQ